MPKHEVCYADVERRLDQLIADLEVHLGEMVATQVELAQSSNRTATRQRASAKIIDWYTDALAMKAKLALPDHNDGAGQPKTAIAVLQVTQQEFDGMIDQVSDQHQQTLAARRLK